jgi:hypothetical protein
MTSAGGSWTRSPAAREHRQSLPRQRQKADRLAGADDIQNRSIWALARD